MVNIQLLSNVLLQVPHNQVYTHVIVTTYIYMVSMCELHSVNSYNACHMDA